MDHVTRVQLREEDESGGIVEKAYTYNKRQFAVMDDLGILE